MQEKPQPAMMRLGRSVSEGWRKLAFDDLAGLDAAGADADTLAATVDLGFDGLEVDVPASAGGVVGVRDVVAELRAFAAEITFVCHDFAPNAESQRIPGDRA
jgi:hypothetical protein